MQRKLLLVGLIAVAGIVIAGIGWLGIYSVNYKPSIGFDGPAGGILLLTLCAGWLLGSVVALLWHAKQRASTSSIGAVTAVIIAGILAIPITSYSISKYTSSNYNDSPREQ